MHDVLASVQWGIEAGSNLWDVLEGWQQGQTQTSWSCDGSHSAWAHPLDVHFQCNVRRSLSCYCIQRRRPKIADVI